jgi:hypothetical protein
MNSELNHTLARQHGAELLRAAERTRLAAEPGTGFTLRGHDLAKLDRFLGQAKRAALRDQREFEGVSIEIGAQGTVSVHATGMRSMVL